MRSLILVTCFFMATVGYCQESKQSLVLTIKSDKQVYEVGQEVTLRLGIKNLSSEKIQAPSLIWSSVVILDGKEHKLKPDYIGLWNGHGEILPKGAFGYALRLSEYGFTNGTQTIGKHNISVKINKTTSNTIAIEAVGKRAASPKAIKAMRIAKKYLLTLPDKDNYEEKVERVDERMDYVDIYFLRKVIAKPLYGIIRVNKKSWGAQWLPRR